MEQGTPKQKAALAALGYTDKTKIDKPPIITIKEIDTMLDCMSDEQLVEYNHWVLCYEILASVAPYLGLLYSEYKATANQLLLLLEKWNASEEAKALADALRKIARAYNLPAIEAEADRITRNAAAKIKYDRLTWKNILRLRDTTEQRLETVKGAIIAIQEWVKAKDCKELVPPIIDETIKDTKTDLALQVSRRYSRVELKRKMAQGVIITHEDTKRAIFPNYAEVEGSKFFHDAVTRRFKELEHQAEIIKQNSRK